MSGDWWWQWPLRSAPVGGHVFLFIFVRPVRHIMRFMANIFNGAAAGRSSRKNNNAIVIVALVAAIFALGPGPGPPVRILDALPIWLYFLCRVLRPHIVVDFNLQQAAIVGTSSSPAPAPAPPFTCCWLLLPGKNNLLKFSFRFVLVPAPLCSCLVSLS